MHCGSTTIHDTSMDVVQRSEKLQVTTYSPAAEFLQSRSWQGLEQQLGKTPVSAAVEGRHGTASGYTHENHTESF